MAEQKEFVCKKCGKAFKSNAGLAAHFSYVHDKIVRADRKAPDANGGAGGVALNYCPACGAKLPHW